MKVKVMVDGSGEGSSNDGSGEGRREGNDGNKR